MSEKLIRWIIFSVLMALVPLLVDVLWIVTRGGTEALTSVLARGELLLITAALCAASVGELFGSGNDRRSRKVISGGAALLILLVSALYFVHVSEAYAHVSEAYVGKERPPDVGVIRTISILLYTSAVVSSGSCVWLSGA